MSFKIIFDKSKNKAKGVKVQEKNDIPEIVGLTKKQFFLFFVACLLLGAGTFGTGYTIAYLKKRKKHQVKSKNKLANFKLNKEAIDENEELFKESVPGAEFIQYDESKDKIATGAQQKKQAFILLGTFSTSNEAKNLQDKLNLNGKNCKIKEKKGYFYTYLGPYDSHEEALNEANLLNNSTSISGSISYDI